ncbi:MAG: molybdenum cofactor guanylyltransferase [Flavobacteriales bacterium]|nr:molybdenum cofactor guanylyltransferase [Flavobacteriales bacterium]
MQVGAIILAGGKSSRMGVDKGLMLLNEKPMVQYVIDTVKLIADELIIVANNEEYKKLGYKVIPDEIENAGPLAGLCIGLKQASYHYNFVLSCDVPFVTKEMLSLLKQEVVGYDAAIFEKANHLHPLIGIYSKNCLPAFEVALNNKELKLKTVLHHVNVKKIEGTLFSDKFFKNINSTLDL